MTEDLATYVMPPDWPTTCPKCGRRTIDPEERTDGIELHTCVCGYRFLVAPDFDGEEQCDNEDCRDFEDIKYLEAHNGLCQKCTGEKEN